MAARKRTQVKKKKATKSKTSRTLTARGSRNKASAKAKKSAARKKPASKKKTTQTKPASRNVRGRSSASKKKPATRKASTQKKAKRSGTRKAQAVKKSSRGRRASTFSAALKVYETGFKLMRSEKFSQAKTAFASLIKEFPNEAELLDRAHVLIQACDNRILEARKSPQLRGADDYYEVGIAELNGHQIDKAIEHLKHALKLSPKGDHIHYALAAAAALNGDRDAALEFLGKAIQYRDENRFQAVNDDDFESLAEDAEFIDLIASDAG